MKLDRLRGTYLAIEVRAGKQKSHRSLKRRYTLARLRSTGLALLIPSIDQLTALSA